MNKERIKAVGFGIEKSSDKFKEIHFTRRPLDEYDILIEILYAGICHSDLHTVKNHWGNVENSPLIPGHEILGRVKEVGSQVKRFKVGDYCGVGCMVDSCMNCPACRNKREQDCKHVVLTYASKDWRHDNEITQGGYSNLYVLNENFGIKIPENADLKKCPSLMCAGITTFSPIHQANVSEDSVCGVLGLGGLGHMAVKYLKALGCDITAFDKEDKADFAKELGIKFVQVDDKLHTDEDLTKSFDFIISTIPYQYDLNTYLPLMKYNGDFAIVGLPPYEECKDINVNIKDMILNYPGVKIWGSQIGGIPETELCAKFSIRNDIYPEVEELEPTPDAINKAYERMLNGDIDGRFVIDMTKLKSKDDE
jgi:uncharacterized zinc-type alcohol dehydrogenase-like protein